MDPPCAVSSNKKYTIQFFKIRKIGKIACQVSIQYTASIKTIVKRHERQKV